MIDSIVSGIIVLSVVCLLPAFINFMLCFLSLANLSLWINPNVGSITMCKHELQEYQNKALYSFLLLLIPLSIVSYTFIAISTVPFDKTQYTIIDINKEDMSKYKIEDLDIITIDDKKYAYQTVHNENQKIQSISTKIKYVPSFRNMGIKFGPFFYLAKE